MQVLKLSLNTLRAKVGREPSHLRVKERFSRVLKSLNVKERFSRALKSLNTCELKRARPGHKENEAAKFFRNRLFSLA